MDEGIQEEKTTMDFSEYFQMLDELVKISGAQKSNFMFSPASLYSALQAAVYAADGNTRQEIINLIGEKEYDLNSEAVNTWNFFVVNHKKDRKTEIREEYAELLQTNQTLSATAYELTEDNCDRLTEEINSRCQEETNRQIPQAVQTEDFQDISPMDRFTALLGNVLHFKGKWQGYCSLKTDFQFTGADGKEKRVDAVDMSSEGLRYYCNETVEAFCAPYKEENGRYTFWGFLPMSMRRQNISRLDLSGLEELGEDYRLYVKIPKFLFQNRMDMVEFLRRSGVHDAFIRWQADFTRGFLFQKGNVYLNSVKQKTVIDFNEEGTESSTFTGIRFNWYTGIEEDEIHLDFDRPFYFLIWDEKEKLPLFVGQVFEPTYV
ncbi:MAG: hypothetical protein LUC95_01735 [Lachnospiraceae bacterium]|nr:hypothetical protein [Lachnospiraceae bacterium]